MKEYKIRKRQMSREQAEDVATMNARGYSVAEIIEYTGLSRHQVVRFFKDNDITDRKLARRPWSDEDYETITRLYNERRTVDEIMAVMHRTRASIWAVAVRLRKAGNITVKLDRKKPKRKKCQR